MSILDQCLIDPSLVVPEARAYVEEFNAAARVFYATMQRWVDDEATPQEVTAASNTFAATSKRIRKHLTVKAAPSDAALH